MSNLKPGAWGVLVGQSRGCRDVRGAARQGRRRLLLGAFGPESCHGDWPPRAVVVAMQ